jgi:gliding motility associated protien GldN
MKSLKFVITGILVTVLSMMGQNVFSQSVLDPRVVVSKDHVRYSDLMWMKRVWRQIDLRQKINHPLYFPDRPSNGRMSFFDSIKDAAMNGDLVAYNPGALGEDDMLTKPYNILQLDSIFNPVTTVKQVDPYTLLESDVEISDPLVSSDVIMYEVKEDWFFDNERSVMEVRIVGICPMIRVSDSETGEFRGYKRLFWLNYSELRHQMINWQVYTSRNDVHPVTFDDLFNKRMFESLVIKESNVYDRYINQYAAGEDALLESDRIERQLLEMEHDLWSY